MDGNVQFLRAAVAVTALKLLLIPSYKSTDFEVHRNWLAITHSLPLTDWYIEERSLWTLDYPPLFAWFEYILAKVAILFDPAMLVVDNLNYASAQTVLFQRLSVIASDLVLMSAAWFASIKAWGTAKESVMTFGLVVGNAGLLMVDHIHFQYNGLLIGILIWSVLAIEQERCVASALLFSVLISMKHLFMYSAPVYFAYLLKHYCLKSASGKFAAFCKLAAVVFVVFGLSFGPFLVQNQIPQIMRRLFPFGRGLCHAYWAPNAWALYSFADKCLSRIAALAGSDREWQPANMSGGLVGQWSFLMLPEITPSVSLLLVFAFSTIPAILLFRHPNKGLFMECVAYANFSGFIWGYHVHEKAILPVLLPLTFVAFRERSVIFSQHRQHFLFLSSVAHYSLTPLLHEAQEYPIKFLLVISYGLYVVHVIRQSIVTTKQRETHLCRCTEGLKQLLLLAIVLLEVAQLFLVTLGMKSKYEFLPLMMTSVLCAAGICWYWSVWTFHLGKMLLNPKAKSE